MGYMSSEGAAQVDWKGLKEIYNSPEWKIMADDDVIAYVKAPDFQAARNRGLEYAKSIGMDIKAKRIYAVRA